MGPIETKRNHNGQLRGLVLDVDGTLLDRAHRITPATHAAVQRARRAGLHVLLASGRSPRSLRPYLSVLGLEGPAVAYTGALTFRLEGAGFRTLAETPMPRADAAAVLALAGALQSGEHPQRGVSFRVARRSGSLWAGRWSGSRRCS